MPAGSFATATRELVQEGFAFFHPASRGRAFPADSLRDLAAGYAHLPADPATCTRRRRYATFTVDGQGAEPRANSPAPYSQQKADNWQDGGALRRFAALPERLLNNRALHTLMATDLRICRGAFPHLLHGSLRVGVHLVRYCATPQQQAFASPPGPHRDTEEVVFLHVISRAPSGRGATNLCWRASGEVVRRQLERSLDSLVLLGCTLHHVTGWECAEGATSAHRDILLVTVDSTSDAG